MIADVKVLDIARRLNLPSSNVSVVISGYRPNPKVRQAIAEAIGKPVSEIWPEQPATKEAS